MEFDDDVPPMDIEIEYGPMGRGISGFGRKSLDKTLRSKGKRFCENETNLKKKKKCLRTHKQLCSLALYALMYHGPTRNVRKSYEQCFDVLRH